MTKETFLAVDAVEKYLRNLEMIVISHGRTATFANHDTRAGSIDRHDSSLRTQAIVLLFSM
jgi:hypothetical protein